MKCEIERMEIIYTFYFFAFLKKVIKKLLTFCYWKDSTVCHYLRYRCDIQFHCQYHVFAVVQSAS